MSPTPTAPTIRCRRSPGWSRRWTRVHLDDGNDAFPPSNLEFTDISTPAGATNLIPGSASTRSSTSASTTSSAAPTWCGWSRKSPSAKRRAPRSIAKISGEAFLTPPGELYDLVVGAIEAETGHRARPVDRRRHVRRPLPDRSSARWSISACPTRPCTRLDESAAVEDIHALTRIYRRILEKVLG